MKRLNRAGLVGLVMGGLTWGAAGAEERLVSLLPPVSRGSQPPTTAPVPTSSGEPMLVAPYDPASSGIKPRGANLPKGMILSEAPSAEGAVVTDGAAAAEVTTELQMELPSVSFPDVGSHFASLFCSGPFNPADVDDPTWVKTEFLMWWFRDMPLPALVTTSDPEDLGVLGQPSTRVVFGDGDQWLPMKLGTKVTIGSWFAPGEGFGVEVGYLTIFNRSQQYWNRNHGTDTLTARPFFNVLDGQQDSAIIGTPAVPAFEVPRQKGTIVIDIPGRMNSLEVNVVSNYCRGANGRVDWFWGGRYVGLFEAVNFFERVHIPQSEPELGGYTAQVAEGFAAMNYNYVAQLGVRTENRWGRLAFNMEGKLGIGWVHKAAKIAGVTNIDQNFQLDAFTGGVLVQRSNAGTYNDDGFTVIPEFGMKLTYEVADHVFVTAGYNILFLANTWRPGDLIDLRLNPNQFPPLSGTPNPFFPQFVSSDQGFWAQGVTLGLEVHY